jgi:M6 family metalloprotease-like protein
LRSKTFKFVADSDRFYFDVAGSIPKTQPLLVIRYNHPGMTRPISDFESEFWGERSVSNFFNTQSNGLYRLTRAGVYDVPTASVPNNLNGDLRSAISFAIASGFSIAQFDTNSNKIIEPSELLIETIQGACPNEFFGLTRDIEGFAIVGTQYLLAPRQLSFGGECENIYTRAHELFHQLSVTGGVDIYGAERSMNFGHSLMGATVSLDNTWFSYLDPWHRMRSGWLDPTVHNSSFGEKSMTLQCQQSSAQNTTLLLYTPERYDTERRFGEYFFVEKRCKDTKYETLADDGIYIWQITQGENGSLSAIPSLPPANPNTDIDSPINLFSSSKIRGGVRPWSISDGIIRLKYVNRVSSDTLFDAGIQIVITANGVTVTTNR